MFARSAGMSDRLDKMKYALKLLRDCGNYDTSIVGAVGEVYAEDVLGMEKGKRGNDSIDGWINGRSIQVKTKEINDDWLTYRLSQRYVQLKDGKQNSVDDLIVVMVHLDNVWVHYYGPINTLEYKKSNGIVRYYLHKMNGEGLVNYDKIIAKLFPSHIPGRKRLVKPTLTKSSNSEIKTNRLIIKKEWIGKNLTLYISDKITGSFYKVPHDQLLEIIKIHSPAALKSKSWIDGEVYSWPQPSKIIDNALNQMGYKINI